VSLRSIGWEELDGFPPRQLVLERLMTKQVEGFANMVGKIIGAITGKTQEEIARQEKRNATTDRRP
jgi:hypothetical protein